MSEEFLLFLAYSEFEKTRGNEIYSKKEDNFGNNNGNETFLLLSVIIMR